MKSLIPFLLPLSLLLLISVVGVKSDKVCKAAVGELTKRQLKGVTECTAAMKFKNAKERTARMTCVMKCVLAKEGILEPDGKADPIGALRFITLNLPDHVQENARNVMMGCYEFTGIVDPEEFNCKSYDPLIKCALSGLNLFCPK